MEASTSVAPGHPGREVQEGSLADGLGGQGAVDGIRDGSKELFGGATLL